MNANHRGELGTAENRNKIIHDKGIDRNKIWQPAQVSSGQC